MAYKSIRIWVNRSIRQQSCGTDGTKAAPGTKRLPAIVVMLLLLAMLAPVPRAASGVLSNPQVDAYGIRVGTQTFGPL